MNYSRIYSQNFLLRLFLILAATQLSNCSQSELMTGEKGGQYVIAGSTGIGGGTGTTDGSDPDPLNPGGGGGTAQLVSPSHLLLSAKSGKIGVVTPMSENKFIHMEWQNTADPSVSTVIEVSKTNINNYAPVATVAANVLSYDLDLGYLPDNATYFVRLKNVKNGFPTSAYAQYRQVNVSFSQLPAPAIFYSEQFSTNFTYHWDYGNYGQEIDGFVVGYTVYFEGFPSESFTNSLSGPMDRNITINPCAMIQAPRQNAAGVFSTIYAVGKNGVSSSFAASFNFSGGCPS